MIPLTPSAYMACAACGAPWPQGYSPTRPLPKARPVSFMAIPDSCGPRSSPFWPPVFTAVGTLIVVFITKALAGGLRVERDEEIQGLDNALHGERGFELDLM